MENEDKTDYKQLYEDLKIKTEADIKSLNENVQSLTATVQERDKKIDELQTYICKNLSTPTKIEPGITFEDRYRDAIQGNKN